MFDLASKPEVSVSERIQLFSPKVLQVCLSTAWGGQEMVAYETAFRARKNGVEITTACPPNTPIYSNLENAGLPVVSINASHRYFSPGAVRTLHHLLQTAKYQSVLIQQLRDLWHVMPALLGKREIRLVAISHSLVGISKKDLLHSFLYGRIDKLIALTEIHRQNLCQNLPVNPRIVEVLPNSVDLRRFSPERKQNLLREQFLESSNELLIGVVSRLDSNKGLLETLSAAERLRRWKIPFRMAIFGSETVGEPGMRTVLADEIIKRNLDDKVFLTGHRDDIESVIASLDVLLMPSPAETFGRVLIEAMASGVPIVASSGGGVKDIVTDDRNGLLVEPLNVESMARALKEICMDPVKRKRIATAGLKYAHEVYDAEKIDAKLLSILGVS